MRPPLIGITTYHREGEARPRFTLPTAYVDAVRAVGGHPVLLPPGEARADRLLEGLDGLLLPGGGDIAPERLGEDAHETSYSTCAERDAFEVDLLELAIERELPTLTICRGTQLLNVARGGDLHMHLPEALPEAIPHRASQEQPVRHGVRLERESVLARVYGETELALVHSWHHQAVRTLGAGLRPVAWAPDGVVEALELDGAPWLLAVQWHPELRLESGSPELSLFRGFVAGAAGIAPDAHPQGD